MRLSHTHEFRGSGMASERSRRRIERLLDEADDAVTQLDWETVSARVTAVLALEPERPLRRSVPQPRPSSLCEVPAFPVWA